MCLAAFAEVAGRAAVIAWKLILAKARLAAVLVVFNRESCGSAPGAEMTLSAWPGWAVEASAGAERPRRTQDTVVLGYGEPAGPRRSEVAHGARVGGEQAGSGRAKVAGLAKLQGGEPLG